MDEARLSEIEARNTARTPGKWTAQIYGNRNSCGEVRGERDMITGWGNVAQKPVDAVFIAACSEDVPDLAKEVRRCWDVIKGFEEAEKDRTVERHRLMADVIEEVRQLLNSDELCDRHLEELGRAYKRLEMFDEKEANRAE